MSTQFFKTKFNTIRNRSFLSHEISRQGTPDKVLSDLYRSMELISINGKNLRDIFISEFKIETRDKTADAINEEISVQLPSDDTESKEAIKHILTIYKKIFFKDIQDEDMKNKLALTLSSITYQKGLFFVLGNSLTEDTVVSEKGYFPQTISSISIHTDDNGFYVDEKCEVTAIKDLNLKVPSNQAIFVHTNPDNSPMMVLQNRFHLCVDDNVLKYAHTDLTMEYNSDLCEKLFDNRGILEKIKDFFKSLFMMNGIENMPTDNPSPGPGF